MNLNFNIFLIFMFLTSIHYHTKEGERLDVGKSCKKMAKDFEKSRVDYLILTDKAMAGEKISLPIRSFKKIKSYLSSKKENLIFGLEFISSDFHILGLDLCLEKWENRVSPKNLEDVCVAIDESNGLVGIPHPFGPCGLGEKTDKILQLYEGSYISHKPLIEVSYYLECVLSLRREIKKENKKAIEYARKRNLAVFSGIDSRFRNFEVAYNVSEEEPQEALRKASKHGFNNRFLIPFLSVSSVPMFRETLYLLRDNGVSLLKTGKASILDYLSKNLF